jgi:hypothetical protein
VRRFLLIITLLVLISCAVPDKHKNFAAIMDSLVGKQADNPDPIGFGRIEKAKDTKQLPNGIVEYTMDHTHQWDKERCIYVLQVDKSTRRFTGWRYISEPNACYVIP